jgi:hypothetical protein
VAVSANKKPSQKQGQVKLCGNGTWTIVAGKLSRLAGRPEKVRSLFKVIGEKIPYSFLNEVKREFDAKGLPKTGVYMAHDSMGYPRYVGRGNIFSRLDARQKAQVLELSYFSFFIVENKIHEREIETIMIRAAGPLLDFNSRKKRNDLQPGDVRDFEPGTKYFERQYKRGKLARKVTTPKL